jgi:hypothetical protein
MRRGAVPDTPPEQEHAMLTLIVLALLAGTEEPPERCSVVPLRNNPEGYFWPLERIRGL